MPPQKNFRSRHPREGGGPALIDKVMVVIRLFAMSEEKAPAVYIMANRYRGTIYIGVTSALWNRVTAHKSSTFDGFTKEYGLQILVWYEHHHAMENAIKREKQLKKWNRSWKLRIIEEMNPDWADLHNIIDPVATLVADEKAGPPPSRG